MKTGNSWPSYCHLARVSTQICILFVLFKSVKTDGGRHQKSCTALVVTLALLSEDSPIIGDLLDPKTHCRERIDGTWRSLSGMIRALSPSNGGSRWVQSEEALRTLSR